MISTPQTHGRVAKARKSSLKWNPLYMAIPAVAFVVVFGIYPLVSFLLGSVIGPDGSYTVDQYTQLITSGYFIGTLLRTVATALMVTAICLVLAYPLAYATMKARGVRKILLIALILLPYLTSVIVRVYAWSALLSAQGPINNFLVAIGVFDEPQLLGHSDFGTGIGMVHIMLPIAALTLWSSLEKVDPSQETAAAALGASRMKTFATVFLPQSIGGAASAGVLVYVLALGAYVIPAALGGTNGLLFAQVVADQATQLLNWNLAAAMGTLMLVAAALPLLVIVGIKAIARSVKNRSAVITPVQSAAMRWFYPVLDLIPPRLLSIGWKVGATVVLIFLLLPELVIIVFSFGPQDSLTLPPASLTLNGWQDVLSDPAWMVPLGRSLVYALIVAVFATLIGAFAAYGFARGRASVARLGLMVLLLPVILPEIVLAIAFYVFANQMGISGTDQGIIIGQSLTAVGMVVVVMTAIVRQVDVNLEYAARMSGASRARAMWEVVAPLIIPGFAVGFFYGFLTAFDNLVLPLFIAGSRTTVTVQMFNSMQQELTTAPAVIASMLLFALMAAITVGIAIQRTGRLRMGLPSDLEK